MYLPMDGIFSILYLHKSHDTCTSLLPHKILHTHCLQFLLGHEDVPREILNYAMQIFGA